MMKKKLATFVIIALFIGIAFSPVTEGFNNIDKNIQLLENNEFLFDNYITFLTKFAHKPSVSACIIINDSVVWSKGYGLYDIENNKPATPDTLYLTASISKTVAATALMQLYEQGLFGLDGDVNDYLPFNLRNPNYPDTPITFRMLLSHRSSLAGDNLYWLCLSYIPGDPDIPSYPYPWLEEYLTPGGNAYSPRVWSDKHPGEELHYANIGYSIIGYLVQLISEQQFDQYCKEHIFTPLGMYNTSYRLKDLDISNIAVPYEYKKGEYFPHPHYGMHVIYPGASMRTSVEEFSHFLIAHMNGGVYKDVRILNGSTVELMHTAHYSPSNQGWEYGLGWIIEENIRGEKEFGHSGGWLGVHTYMNVRPNDNTAVIIFTNSLEPNLGTTLVERLAFSLITNALFKKANRLAS